MTTQPPLIPRQPRRMKQPRKSTLREQMALAATQIADQRQIIEHQEAQLQSMREAYAQLWANTNRRAPWWRKLWRIAA